MKQHSTNQLAGCSKPHGYIPVLHIYLPAIASICLPTISIYPQYLPTDICQSVPLQHISVCLSTAYIYLFILPLTLQHISMHSLSMHSLSLYLSTHPPTAFISLSTSYMYIYLSIQLLYLAIHPPTASISLSVHSIYLSIHPSTLSIHPLYPFIHSICPSRLSTCVCIHSSVYPSINSQHYWGLNERSLKCCGQELCRLSSVIKAEVSLKL